MSNLSSKLPSIARVVLGLVFFVFGLNGFLHFLPQPPMSGPPADFAGALFATGYMFPLIKGTEVLGGLLLLSNRYVPLALAVLAPVVVNIIAFHAFLAPAGLILPLVLLGLELYLARAFKDAFLPMLHARTEPHTPAPASERDRVPVHAD
ncbi:MAG TPA: DoxX family membrane protein [Polyangiaceae bacterium]|nr:DoxX family membrane protein [Polyangiaceae bacterium]